MPPPLPFSKISPTACAIAAIALAILVFNLASSTAGLRLAAYDDVALTRGLTEPAVAASNRMHEFQMGRFYVDPKYHLQEAVAAIHSDMAHSFVRVAFFLAAVSAAAWFTYALTANPGAALVVMLAGVGWLQLSITYQTFLSYPHLWLAWAAIWAMGAFALRPESLRARIGVMAAYGIALSVHEAAVPFILWPVAVRWAVRRTGSWQEEWRRNVGCLVILAAYLACYLWLRHAGRALPETLYVGGQVSLVVGEAIFALVVFATGPFPGLEAWVNRWSASHESLLYSPAEWWQRIVTWSEPRDYAITGLMVAAVGIIGFLSRPREGAAPGWRVIPVLGFAIVAPILLLSISLKNQWWSHQRMWPYYYSSMSYLAQVVTLVVGATLVLPWIKSRRVRTAVGLLCLLFSGVLTLSIRAVNRESEWLLRQHTFGHVDEFRSWMNSQPEVRAAVRPGGRKPLGDRPR
jgi:hypothetical protein